MVDINGNVGLCECAGWMPAVVGNLFEQTLTDILSNPLSTDIRRSISHGTYEYCNEKTCGVLVQQQLATMDQIAPVYQDCVRSPEHFVMPHIIRIAGDLTCNLSCPSCRTQVIKVPEDQVKQQVELGQLLQQNLFSTPSDQHIILHVSTSGELFASAMLLEFVNSISIADFPNLELHIQTNGLLAPSRWHRLGSMQQRVKMITVTTDAATAGTYEKLRRGGRWQDLQQSLQWLSNKKTQNGMRLGMRMVVQLENYREIEEFYHQATELNADVIEYGRLTNWFTYTPEQFAHLDVFDPAHPEYPQAQTCLDKVKKYSNIFLSGGIS
jgi:MoaA/NifB/PqqE/SkfB family radical SAM enzyme